MAIWQRFFGNAASTAAGFGIGAALGPALRPLTQAVANEQWARFPERPLSDAAAAAAVVRGLMPYDAAAGEARLSGTNPDRFAILHGLAGEPPAPQELLALWNRGEIDSARVNEGLRQSRLRPEWFAEFKALRRYLPPVSDLITWAVREVFSPDQRAALDLDAEYPAAFGARAAELGYSDDDARNAWAGHWDMPSRTEGADMWHRGEISEADYDRLLRALDFAPTWRGPLKAISRAIPTMTDMVRLAVRDVYDPPKRAAQGLDEDLPPGLLAQLARHGMIGDDALDLWAGHWRLPSATQGYQMLWRDQIDDAKLKDLLRALDYPPEWRPWLQNIAYHPLGRIDLRRLYAEGLIDKPRVLKGYRWLGYNAADAALLTEYAVKQAGAATGGKDWLGTARTRLYTVAHNEYLDGTIDAALARDVLGSVGVPVDQVPDVLALWDVENGIARKELTPSQVKKAFTATAWTRDEALTSLIDRGYSPEDAETFLDL